MSNLFEREGPLRPGDVVLLFAGPTPTKFVLGTWLQSIAQDERCAAASVPIVVLGLDRTIMGDDSAARVIEEMSLAVGDRFPAPRIIELGTEEAKAGLAACPLNEPNAIVAILDVERLRFADVEPSGPKVESVEGSVIRISEKDDLSLPHVTKLCAAICDAAPASGQKWLIVSRGYGFGAEIPPALEGRKNLDIHQMAEESYDRTLAKEFRDQLANIQSIGPDNALRWIAERLPPGKTATIARANVLSLSAQPVQAYRAIASVAPQILKDGFPEEIIQLAQMALSAGRAAESLKWARYLPPVGTLGAENLRAARLLARHLGEDALGQRCVAEFRRRFPNDPLSLLDRFNELLDANEYESAAQQAEATVYPFRREAALYLANPTEPPVALLKAAELAGELPEAYWTIAKSAKRRKDYGVCRDYLRRLADDEERGGRAIAMRLDILGAQIPGIAEAELHEELRGILVWCATHPTELEARFALEGLYEAVSTEKELLVHTAVLLSEELGRLAKLPDLASIPVRAAIDEPLPESNNEQLGTLVTELIGPADQEGFAIGTARLSAAQAAIINPQLWADMSHWLSDFTDEGDTNRAIKLLHTIMAVARETHDPASDLMAARQVVSLLANSNAPQDALDLAESLLTLLPANHNDHKGWRLSMAWLAYADASIRLGNVLAGLRFVSFACFCLLERPLNARLFLEVFRTAARVAREIDIPPLALQFLDLERNLLKSFPIYKRRPRQLEQMVLSIMLKMWRPAKGADGLLVIVHGALDLLDQCEPGEEIAPLLSVAAQAAQFYGQTVGAIPADLRAKLEGYLSRMPESARGAIRAILVEGIDVGLLRLLATKTIRASGDWSVSLSPALVAARRALSMACASGDAELFWTACLIICQPGLSVRVSERKDQNLHADPIAASKWLAKQINAGTENPLEAVLVQRAMSHSSAEAIGEKLFEISLEEFLTRIEPHETVVLLATDNTSWLYRLELRRGTAGMPTKVGVAEWNPRRFNRWSRVYPAKYGHDLEIYFGGLCKPPRAEVPPTLVGLLPSGRLSTSIATVVAEGRLFNFAHRLASEIAGSPTSVAVCPSARWLGFVRRQALPISMAPVAWLGSPATTDDNLKDLQDELRPVMQSLKVELSDAKTLPDFRARSFVILGSHGQAKNADGFGRLTDMEEVYEPDQVAAAFAETACVVLFVCHGGRGDEGMFSHETTGLTSSLLRHGVRTVVAALWPLDVTLAVAWLEEFGKTNPNDTMVERVDRAQQAMAKRPALSETTGEHPLARCTFTVFGDGALRIKFPGDPV